MHVSTKTASPVFPFRHFRPRSHTPSRVRTGRNGGTVWHCVRGSAPHMKRWFLLVLLCAPVVRAEERFLIERIDVRHLVHASADVIRAETRLRPPRPPRGGGHPRGDAPARGRRLRGGRAARGQRSPPPPAVRPRRHLQ